MRWAGRGPPKGEDARMVGEPISGIPEIPTVPAPPAVLEVAGGISFISWDGDKGVGIRETDGVCVRL